METGQIIGLIFLGTVLFYLVKWVFTPEPKDNRPEKTVLKLSMPEIEVDENSGMVSLVSGQDMTIPRAIEMVQSFQKLPKQARDKGLEFTNCTDEQKKIFRAVIAIENELAEARGAQDEIIVLNERGAIFDREMAQQVMQFYQTPVDDNDADHPLTADPRRAFEKPDRG